MPSFRCAPVFFALAVLLPSLAPAQKVIEWTSGGHQLDVPSNVTNPIAIGGNQTFSIALRADGTVVAWGDNTWGQTSVPNGLSHVVAIAAGRIHALALKSDGTVVAWGDPSDGSCDVPAGLKDVVGIAASDEDSFAVKANGTVVGWGQNDHGRVIPPDGLTRVAQVAATSYYTLALKTNGTVVAWGNDYEADSVFAGQTRIVQLGSGLYHSLALKSDGTVLAYGSNLYHQTNVPAGLSDVVQVTGGESCSLALKGDGTVVGWGRYTDPTFELTGVVQIACGGNNCLAIVAAAHCILDQKLVLSGGSATGTVKLANPAGSGGTVVGLLSDDSSVHVPATVTVPEGATSATFPVFTDAFAGPDQLVRVQTSYNDTATVPFRLRVRGVGVSLATSVPSVIGGSTSRPSLTVSVADAVAANTTFTLASSNPLVTVPASVTIAAGHTSGRVILGHSLTVNSRTITLSASTAGYLAATTPLVVKPVTATVRFSPESVEGGETSVGTVLLNAVLASPMSVSLSSGNASVVPVPPSVTVAQGASSTTFNAKSALVAQQTSVVIGATVNGRTFSARLTIVPGVNLATLTVPTYGYGLQTLSGSVHLSKPAPTGGFVVSLSANDPVSVPSGVTVAAGQTDATFNVSLDDFAATTTATIQATGGAVSLTKTISVRPLTVAAFTISVESVVGGTSLTGTVTLNVATARATRVTLASDDTTAASVPSSVIVPAGSKTATFTITTKHVTVAKNAKITASKNGSSLYRTVKVNH